MLRLPLAELAQGLEEEVSIVHECNVAVTARLVANLFAKGSKATGGFQAQFSLCRLRLQMLWYLRKMLLCLVIVCYVS